MECLHVGTPPSDYECWETKIIHFHNFLDLPDAKGKDNFVESPEFKCFGHKWRLKVFPGGTGTAKDGRVSICIFNVSEVNVTINFEILMLTADGYEKKLGGEKMTLIKSGKGRSIANAVKRAWLVEHQSYYLDRGALKIKVQLRLSKGCYHNTIRQHLSHCDNVNVAGDEETCDIAFDLRGEIMVAHKCIIKSKASDFYVMCDKYSKTSPMPINDVEPYIFFIMLRSLYGDEVFPEEWQNRSEDILNAASKYGFSTLKSEAEVWYSKSLKFTVDNVIEKFMEADGKNYSLVKAAAKQFIMNHGKEVVASESFNSLYESKELMREVMTAAFDNSKKRKREGGQES
eukprot:scaffold28907_cov22-Cyclotella_meneghiniana.AAC.2